MAILAWFGLFGCLITVIAAKQMPTGAEVMEKCKHELQDDDNGMAMGKFSGCFLGCVLEATGVLEFVNVEGPQNGSYRVNLDTFHYLFEKEPLNLYAHTCMDVAPLKYLTYDNVCENSINFYGCMEDWLTRDLIYAVYNYYGTKPEDIFEIMTKRKTLDQVKDTVKKMYNMTMTCSQYPMYWNNESDVCFNRCLWEQVGLFEADQDLQEEKFRNLFSAERLNETAIACKPQLDVEPVQRCKVIEEFYVCTKNGLTAILEQTISAPFGNGDKK
uniref:Long D7 protein n=1 Tax=Simulium nigrimanum TaxID=683695 RepID=D1FQ07_SIMNI